MTIQENVPLAPLTTLQVGGAARYFAELKREDEVREAAQFAKPRTLPLFVLGGGSNLVVADSGWPGLVLRIAIGGITTQRTDASGNAVLFSVGAGGNWDDFVAQAVVQNCAGVECLSGIPGSVGGTPVQNVCAYRQEGAETTIAAAPDRSSRIPCAATRSSKIWPSAPPRKDSKFPATPLSMHNAKFQRHGWWSTRDSPRDMGRERPESRTNTLWRWSTGETQRQATLSA